MDDLNDVNRRLAAEAEFQNRRVLSSAEGREEPRERFYYLADKGRADYHRLLEDVVGKTAVVVGCSEGGVTPLARRGAQSVIGIDIADEAIHRLKAAIEREGLSERALAVVMNAESLDLAAASVDVICCAGVLHHLDVGKAARSWSRVLRPSGKVVMIEPMAWHPVVALYRMLTPSMRTPDEHPLKPADVEILREHFGSVRMRGYVLTSVASVLFTLWPRATSVRHSVLRHLERLDDRLLRWFPFLVYFCWTCVIELAEPRRHKS